MYVGVFKSGNHEYCRLAESYRDENGKVKTKVIKNFGRVDKLTANDPDAVEKLKQQYGGSREDKVEARGKSRAEELSQHLKNNPLLNLDSYPCLNYGYWVLKALWKRLGLDRKLPYLQSTKTKIQFDLNEVISFLAFSKVLDPHSLRRTFADKDFFIGAPMQNITLNNCYDTLSVLKEHKDSIFKGINARLDEYYGKDRSLLLFYDVTNTYLESPMSDEEWLYKQVDFYENRLAILLDARDNGELDAKLFDKKDQFIGEYDFLPPEIVTRIEELKIEYLCMRGPSKEHRYDLPIVSIALIMDRNGFPIDFEVYSGNASEFKTMKQSIEGLKKKYHAKETIVVADRGLNSASNLQMLQDEKLGYLMAQKVTSLPKAIEEQMLKLEEYTSINEMHPELGKYRIIKDFKKPVPGTKDVQECTLVLTYSEERRKRDECLLDKQVEKVRKKASVKAKITPSSTSGAEIAEVAEGQSKTATIIGVDDDAVAKRRKLCGYAAMVYKSAPVEDGKASTNNITDDAIASVYHQLTAIEECFRIMKSNLGLRPMFVWQSDHIRGHVTVCVLALLLIKMLQKDVNEQLEGDEVSIDDLCAALDDANVMFMKPSVRECVFIPQMSRTQNVRRDHVTLCDEDLLEKISSKSFVPKESLISRCMRAVNLTPIKGIMNRPELAHCLKTRFDSDEEVVSPILLKQMYPTLCTTIPQK